MYLRKRHEVWWAFHEVPADLRAALGKARFAESLKTKDQTEAKRRGAELEAAWRAWIAEARAKRLAAGTGGGVGSGRTADIDHWAMHLRSIYLQQPDAAGREEVRREAVTMAHEDIILPGAARAGVLDYDDPRFDGLPVHQEAKRFVGEVTGEALPLATHLPGYLKAIEGQVARKTRDERERAILAFLDRHPTAASVTFKAVEAWASKALETHSAATVRKAVSALRGFWQYLQAQEIVAREVKPFDDINALRGHRKSRGGIVEAVDVAAIQAPGKGSGGARSKGDALLLDAAPKHGGRRKRPWSPAAVVALHRGAQDRGDTVMADAIELAAYTGCRLDELCWLRPESLGGDGAYITIQDAKTDAGNRRVPVHPALRPTLDRLVKTVGPDGFLLKGLTANKYGQRSQRITNAFIRLRDGLGFPRLADFHSFRRTVATLMEDGGVPENVAAAILGHDRPGLSYGLYSGGPGLEAMAKAIRVIRYPEFCAAGK